MRTCSYCGRQWKEIGEACAFCGAPSKISHIEKWEPFFYEGYIVYALKDYCRGVYSHIFYKGVTYMGRVDTTFEEVERMSPTIDIMPSMIERL